MFIDDFSCGGEGGIRTPGTSFGSYNGLANRRLQPLGHLSAGLAIKIVSYSLPEGQCENARVYLWRGNHYSALLQKEHRWACS